MDDYKGALNDYTQAIKISSDYVYTYLSRGQLLQNHFNSKKAIPDFKKVLELQTEAHSNGNAKPFALLHLGRTQEAISWMLAAVDKYPSDGNYYDLACLYARTNQPEKALENLNIAIEKGFSDYIHMKNDPGLANLRKNETFTELVNNLKNKVENSKFL